jgi:hypothetical protein
VIDIDKEGDSADVIFINEQVDSSNKGKAVEDVFDGYDDLQAQVCD